MKNHLSIYLAGNIKKEHEKESAVFWTQKDQDILRKGLAPNDISFLNPATRMDDLSDQKSVFGRDMLQVYCANVVFVDVRERRGLGVGAEMMWAKMNHLPVLSLAPKNSHYRKKEVTLLDKRVENWVHPFVYSLSDAIVQDLEEAITWLIAFLLGDIEIKGPQSINDAMRYYKEMQLKNDSPMSELIEKNQFFKKRIQDLASRT